MFGRQKKNSDPTEAQRREASLKRLAKALAWPDAETNESSRRGSFQLSHKRDSAAEPPVSCAGVSEAFALSGSEVEGG